MEKQSIQDTYNRLRAEYAMDILTYVKHKQTLVKQLGEEMYNKVFGNIETGYQVKLKRSTVQHSKPKASSLLKANALQLENELKNSVPDFLNE